MSASGRGRRHRDHERDRYRHRHRDGRTRTRLFHEFGQVPNPLQAKVRGTGLGLSLSKRLAELLGGSVGVRARSAKDRRSGCACR